LKRIYNQEIEENDQANHDRCSSRLDSFNHQRFRTIRQEARDRQAVPNSRPVAGWKSNSDHGQGLRLKLTITEI